MIRMKRIENEMDGIEIELKDRIEMESEQNDWNKEIENEIDEIEGDGNRIWE